MLKPWRYYSWRRRYRERGMEGLKNHKSQPQSTPHKLLDEEKDTIVEMALTYPELSTWKLAYFMQNNDLLYVSQSSVYRVLLDNDLVCSRESEDADRKADGTIDVEAPHEMWHTDITYIPVEDDHAYLISVLDGYSRYVVHDELCRTMTAQDMERVLSRALFKADLFECDKRPALVSDNGTQMVARSFKEFLDTWDVEHIQTAVRHPESNGKIEVFHKTVKYENVYRKDRYGSFYEAKDDIEQFIEFYNHERLHQGIDYVTPYERYTGRDRQIIKRRRQKHQDAIERRKRMNRKKQQLVA